MKADRTPFDILGVTRADDMTTIRMAWRAMVRKLHPDVVGNSAEATERLAEINAAFDALQGHVPCARARAAKEAGINRELRRSERAARAEWRRREAARREAKAVEARLRAERLAREAERARQEFLNRHRGSLHSKAANGYARASRILSA